MYGSVGPSDATAQDMEGSFMVWISREKQATTTDFMVSELGIPRLCFGISGLLLRRVVFASDSKAPAVLPGCPVVASAVRRCLARAGSS